MTKTRVVVLGAGFGGLEVSTRLLEQAADDVEITIIDRNAGFVFGFSKLDVMFGHRTLDEVTHRYDGLDRPGLRFVREEIVSIDPETRTVTTDSSNFNADVLVVALGADYDLDATPGVREGAFEFYSVAGAQRAREAIASFTGGRIVIGVLGPTFKCPPAPFETAFLLHDDLVKRGIRDDASIHVVNPLPMAIPVSKDTSDAIADALTERGIGFTFGELITMIDPTGHRATFRSGGTIDYDLLLAIPVHRAPEVVAASGLTVDGWIPVDQANLRTRFDGVYAVGDVASAPVPRAGVFAENAARTVADDIIATIRGTAPPPPFKGRGNCYIEFGDGRVGKVDADFLSGSSPRADLVGPSVELTDEKARFSPTRIDRWFARG